MPQDQEYRWVRFTVNQQALEKMLRLPADVSLIRAMPADLSRSHEGDIELVIESKRFRDIRVGERIPEVWAVAKDDQDGVPRIIDFRHEGTDE